MISIAFELNQQTHPTNSNLTPKVLGVFFIKIASKQPLFKARSILQT
jgi:hypothetical protein